VVFGDWEGVVLAVKISFATVAGALIFNQGSLGMYVMSERTLWWTSSQVSAIWPGYMWVNPSAIDVARADHWKHTGQSLRCVFP